ncbi:MAG TPA: FHA domain-containing protein [Solirubrobacteraceae bacterium]
MKGVGMESLTSGTLAGTGSFRCEICGHVITMTATDVLPQCPGCEGASFTRASLFSAGARFKRMDADVRTPDGDAQIDSVCAGLDEPGRYLVFHDSGSVRSVPVPEVSMRIGRSLTAELRFEDPTVSRRHAVLLAEKGGMRVLDDRSLNGVFVNDERIVSQLLEDGDEIVIGRYRLRFVDRSAVGATPAGSALQAE